MKYSTIPECPVINGPAKLFNRSTLYFSGFVMLLSFLIYPVDAIAESVVNATSNKPGSFGIVANNVNRMMSAEISIYFQSYDLTPPKLSGSFLKTATLTTVVSSSGLLIFKFESKKPVNGYVPLAIAEIAGSITSITAKLINQNGSETARVSFTNPTKEQLDEIAARKDKAEQPDINNKSDKGDTAVTSGRSNDRVQVQPDTAASSVVQEQSVPPSAVESSPEHRANRLSGESGAKSSSASPASRNADRPDETEEVSGSLIFARRENLIKRFSARSGERTSATLARLLEPGEADVIQEPLLLLSNGTASLRLTVRAHGHGEHAPQFFISGSRCIDVKTGENGTWILEIIPERGTLAASVMVLAGREVIEYPLSVAPPLELFNTGSASLELVEFVRAANELVLSGAMR